MGKKIRSFKNQKKTKKQNQKRKKKDKSKKQKKNKTQKKKRRTMNHLTSAKICLKRPSKQECLSRITRRSGNCQRTNQCPRFLPCLLLLLRPISTWLLPQFPPFPPGGCQPLNRGNQV